MLENSVEKFPDRIAFSDSTESVTYAESIKRAKSVASTLADFANEHKAVAVMVEKSCATLISFFGVIYSGNFYVPIDTEMPVDRVKLIFDVVKPVAIITDEENESKSEELAQAFGMKKIAYKDALATAIDEDMLTYVRRYQIDTDPIYALFTSGSTGVPKGVVCCHRSVIDYADWVTEFFKLDETTIFGSQTPFYFSMSVLDIYTTIRSGAELNIIPKQFFAFPLKLLEHMNAAKINTIYWVPTALCIVANLKALDKMVPEHLKRVLFAGEAMPNKQLNIWRKHLPDVLYANLFGPTEITDIGICYVVDREFADDEPLPIGTTCSNVDAIVLDDEGNPTPKGEKGELCIRGSFLAMGYYDNPDKTSEAFIQNPLNPHYPEVIYKTGDLVSVNEFGEFMYHGRKDFQIKHRGNRIELGEIENAAFSVPGMISCACIYDEEKEKIVLFYQGEGLTTQDIRGHMESKVPSYMLPNVMVEVENMPTNQNGKIDRKELKNRYKK